MKPLARTPVPPSVTTETSLAPGVAVPVMVIFADICVELSTLKLFSVIPAPKLTEDTPVKSMPLIIASYVCPWMPRLGLTESSVGTGCVTLKQLVRVVVPPAVVTTTLLLPELAAASTEMLAVNGPSKYRIVLLIQLPRLPVASLSKFPVDKYAYLVRLLLVEELPCFVCVE